MSSVLELQANNTIDRKKLMQAVLSYLGQSKIEANLIQEPVLDSAEVSIFEPVIQLKNQRIDSIRLVREAFSACGKKEPLRFQYKMVTTKPLPADLLPNSRPGPKPSKPEKRWDSLAAK